jgi:Flp pilus assembly protein TadG
MGNNRAQNGTKGSSVMKIRIPHCTWLKSSARKSEGGALVEIAVTLPLVLLIMTGIFSFSVALYQKLMLSEAVSAGGRQAAVEAGQTAPCTDITNAVKSAAPGLDPTQMTTTITVTNPTTNASKSCPGLAATDVASGDQIQLIVTYPCSLNVYGVSYAACSLTSEITEVAQ